MSFFEKNCWAFILGGSSGFGLATAKKLSQHGMNICIVHRDRRGSMQKIEEHFDEIRNNKVGLLTYNQDALNPEVRRDIIASFSEKAGTGHIKLLLHSIAFGNLKLLVPLKQSNGSEAATQKLAAKLNVNAEELQSNVNALFNEGVSEFHTLAEPPNYSNEVLLEEEDIANTVYAMGTSLIGWTQDIFKQKLFNANAQVIGLTSEGNSLAWYSYAAVSIAKTALEAASRSIAKEFAPYGIRSNIVQPGVTFTPALRLIPGSQHLMAKAKLGNPLQRMTQPQDVANVMYLLCQEEASWINASLIRVDGGEKISK